MWKWSPEEEENLFVIIGLFVVLIGAISSFFALIFYIPPIRELMVPYGSLTYQRWVQNFWALPVCGAVAFLCGLIGRLMHSKVWSKVPIIGGIVLLSVFTLLYLTVGPPN